MAYQFIKQSVSDKVSILSEMIAEHHLETMFSFDTPTVSVDQFSQLENLGILHGIFVYNNDQIVGYSLFCLSPNIHYQTMMVAQATAIYVAPEHRGRVGLKLISETEKLARELGADSMLWSARHDSRLVKVFERLGYAKRDISFLRSL